MRVKPFFKKQVIRILMNDESKIVNVLKHERKLKIDCQRALLFPRTSFDSKFLTFHGKRSNKNDFLVKMI